MAIKNGNGTSSTNFDRMVSDRPSRRQVLKAAAAGSLAAVPFGLAKLAFSAHAAGVVNSNVAISAGPANNPSWYGFNLLEYFSTDADWMAYFPYKNDGMFVEDDFRWIHDWGFNFVRLPMDYRFWTAPDLVTINEKAVEPIDRAIRLGEKYGVHVNICLHRAPGLCILDTMDAKLTGISVTKEKTNVYTDKQTFDAFVHQWVYFAERYKHIDSNILSFNLVNEPIALPSAAELADLEKKGPVTARDLFSAELLSRHAADYIRLARASNDAIRAHDPKRLAVC